MHNTICAKNNNNNNNKKKKKQVSQVEKYISEINKDMNSKNK